MQPLQLVDLARGADPMTSETALWRIDNGVQRVQPSRIGTEEALESLIEANPGILGEPLLFIGRQVPTEHGKIIDLLGLDGDGGVHVLELKRDRTPRDAVAQALDYGSWIQTLDADDIRSIFEKYSPGVALEAAFSERFGVALPETINDDHRLLIVAAELDAASERIVEYVAAFGVPINVAFFQHFTDDGRSYLARSLLVANDEAASATTSKRSTGEPWNGQDWYVSFGEDSAHRSWDDARRYGFVSAGGGTWYSRTIRSLPVGGRVFVCIPGQGVGYVGVGKVVGEAMPFEVALLDVDGHQVRMRDLTLQGDYTHVVDDDDPAEYIVPVEWERTVDRADAVWEKGYFANQNSACKLRNRFTLDGLYSAFGLVE